MAEAALLCHYGDVVMEDSQVVEAIKMGGLFCVLKRQSRRDWLCVLLCYEVFYCVTCLTVYLILSCSALSDNIARIVFVSGRFQMSKRNKINTNVIKIHIIQI